MPVKSKNPLSFTRLSLYTVLLSILPEKQLSALAYRAVKGFLGAEDLHAELCFASSGRAALTMVFRYLCRRQAKPVDTLLLPDYICNVVCAAAEYSGLRVRFYETSDYAPCMKSVERALNECDNACVLFASLMGHRCMHDALYTAVRASHPDTPIVFDECQNIAGLRDGLPTLAREDVYCVISFNNKMTQGLLGGAVYGLPREGWNFEPQPHAARGRMQLNMTMSYIRQNMNSLREYITGRYHAPEDEEKSACNGKYCVAPYRIYRISLAAAYLGIRNWARNERTLIENGQTLLRENGALDQVSKGDNPIPLYIPIGRDSGLIGRYPLKGRYWTRIPCPQYQDHLYIIAHNTIKIRGM